jgi:hypothetical protein
MTQPEFPIGQYCDCEGIDFPYMRWMHTIERLEALNRSKAYGRLASYRRRPYCVRVLEGFA